MSIRNIARPITLVLAIVFTLWLVFFFVRGQPMTMVQEVPLGQPMPEGQIVYQSPYLPALFPLPGVGLVILGLLLSFLDQRAMFISWFGLFITLITGVVLIWSIGLHVIAFAAFLFVPLAVSHWQTTNNRLWVHLAWVGVALLAVYGAFMFGVPIAYFALVACIGFAVMLLVLEWKLARPRIA